MHSRDVTTLYSFASQDQTFDWTSRIHPVGVLRGVTLERIVIELGWDKNHVWERESIIPNLRDSGETGVLLTSNLGLGCVIEKEDLSLSTTTMVLFRGHKTVRVVRVGGTTGKKRSLSDLTRSRPYLSLSLQGEQEAPSLWAPEYVYPMWSKLSNVSYVIYVLTISDQV